MNNILIAYFCGRVKNSQTNSDKAIQFAKEFGYKLWVPSKKVKNYTFPTGAHKCKQAIERADCVICQPPIGRDCAWELGFAHGLGKDIYCLGELSEDDWMTKIGIKYV